MLAGITGAGAAGLVLAATAPHTFGLAASPASIHAAAGHSYRVTVTDTGTHPLTVSGAAAPATGTAHGCAIALGRAAGWATVTPARATVAPGHPGVFTVTVAAALPPGRSEAVAAFTASAGRLAGGTGARAVGGVGVAVYVTAPGRSTRPPCKAAARTAASRAGLLWPVAGASMALVILAGVLVISARRLRRRQP